jgi:hypothetical protein
MHPDLGHVCELAIPSYRCEHGVSCLNCLEAAWRDKARPPVCEHAYCQKCLNRAQMEENAFQQDKLDIEIQSWRLFDTELDFGVHCAVEMDQFHGGHTGDMFDRSALKLGLLAFIDLGIRCAIETEESVDGDVLELRRLCWKLYKLSMPIPAEHC